MKTKTPTQGYLIRTWRHEWYNVKTPNQKRLRYCEDMLRKHYKIKIVRHRLGFHEFIEFN